MNVEDFFTHESVIFAATDFSNEYERDKPFRNPPVISLTALQDGYTRLRISNTPSKSIHLSDGEIQCLIGLLDSYLIDKEK